jgi:uncharacterized protein (TIGR02646 family)
VRKISKGHEPPSITGWKALENENWIPTYGVLQNPQKEELHSALLREQGYTCCYCGREIDSTDSHIEHFRPRSKYGNLDLDYENLHASCQRELPPASPRVCGHLKDEEFDEESFLSPLLPSIEERFAYTLTGDLVPRDDAAERMIHVLGLNKPFLTSRRSEALLGVFDSDFLTSATEAELSKIAAEFRRPDQEGKLPPFFHAVARFSEDLLVALENQPKDTKRKGFLRWVSELSPNKR